MQDLIIDDDSFLMPEERIDVNMLSRVDSDQKATSSRVDGMQQSLHSLGREVSEIKGILQSNETPAWIKNYAYPCCALISAAMVGAVITLLVQVHGLQTFLHQNGGFIAGLRLENIAPSDPRQTQEVKLILDQAKKAKVTIDPQIIKQTGETFFEAAEQAPEAWGAALDIANYRSDINSGSLPALANLRKQTGDGKYAILLRIADFAHPGSRPSVTEKNVPAEILLAGNAPAESGAKVTYFDQPQNGGTTAQYVLINWLRPEMRFGLDGISLRNVIIKNAVIVYYGGPIRLDNVFFVNCTFQYVPTPSGINLGKNLVASASVTFFNPG